MREDEILNAIHEAYENAKTEYKMFREDFEGTKFYDPWFHIGKMSALEGLMGRIGHPVDVDDMVWLDDPVVQTTTKWSKA
jgi:hypothetical protein